MNELPIDDRIFFDDVWLTDDLLPRLKTLYRAWLRDDVTSVHLEGGDWGVGLVIAYAGQSDYRELLNDLGMDGDPSFDTDQGPEENARRFIRLAPYMLITCTGTALLTERACRDISLRAGYGDLPPLGTRD